MALFQREPGEKWRTRILRYRDALKIGKHIIAAWRFFWRATCPFRFHGPVDQTAPLRVKVLPGKRRAIFKSESVVRADKNHSAPFDVGYFQERSDLFACENLA